MVTDDRLFKASRADCHGLPPTAQPEYAPRVNVAIGAGPIPDQQHASATPQFIADTAKARGDQRTATRSAQSPRADAGVVRPISARRTGRGRLDSDRNTNPYCTRPN